jgi:hypothetical protein
MSWQLFWECRKGLHHRCRGQIASADALGQDLHCSCPHHLTGKIETVFFCFVCRKRIPASEAGLGCHAHLDREAA